jgi:hypothetical protein
MSEAGATFSHRCLALATVARLCRAVVNPYETMQKLRNDKRFAPTGTKSCGAISPNLQLDAKESRS